MDPSQTPTPQTPSQSPAPAPGVMPPTPTSGQPMPTMSANSKPSKKKFVIPLILTLVVLAAAALLAYLFYFSPSAQTKRQSTKFMGYITTNKPDQAAEVAGATSAEEKAFLSDAASKLQGSYSQSQSTSKDGTYYYLYTLTNPKYKYARTSIKKENGKYIVDTFVYDTQALKLIPGADSVSTTTSSTTASPTTTAKKCLVATDFDALYKANTGEARPADIDYTQTDTPYTDNLHFKPDSLDYIDAEETQPVNQIVNSFYKPNSSKTFVISIKGSVATTVKADLDFANQRAQKVKDLFKSKGVDEAHLKIEAPGNVNDVTGGEAANTIDQEISRLVLITIDTTCK